MAECNWPRDRPTEFLRAAGGAAAAAAFARPAVGRRIVPPISAIPTPFLPGTSPTETIAASAPTVISATPTPESLVGRVALIRTTDRAEGVRRALDLLGINPVQGKAVFLKPNLNSADHAPGSTHRHIAGPGRTSGEGAAHHHRRSSGMGDTRR
jgi:hypothetical protein